MSFAALEDVEVPDADYWLNPPSDDGPIFRMDPADTETFPSDRNHLQGEIGRRFNPFALLMVGGKVESPSLTSFPTEVQHHRSVHSYSQSSEGEREHWFEQPSTSKPVEFVDRLVEITRTESFGLSGALTSGFEKADEWADARSELEVLRRYQDGWNGPRSKGAVPISFGFAKQFLALLSGELPVRKIEPTIFPLGTAVLEIETEANRLMLEFSAEGQIFATVDTPGRAFDFDIERFSGRSIPAELLDHLKV